MKSTALQFNLPSAMKATLIAFVAMLAALAGRSPAWAQYDPGQTDLAIGGIATSTRTDFGATVQAGIDGNRDGKFGDGSVFYENADPTPGATSYFYQVDLGQNDYINRIQFLPRTDDTTNPTFGNFNISIYPADPANPSQPAATPSFSQNYNSSYFGFAFATAAPGIAAAGGANGRFVKITRLDNNYWLTFAEMEVVGSATPLTHTLSNDIALGKPVTLDPGDTAAFGSTLASGNDGDINGDFNAPSQGPITSSVHPVFHATNQGATNSVYWQVDLGADTHLSYANLMARMTENTTFEFEVQVYNHNMNLVDTKIVSNSDVTGTTPGYDHAIDLTGDTGEFIRVTPGPDAGVSNLAFSELQVFAALSKGDFNRDGRIDAADIQAMLNALVDLSKYQSTGGLSNDELKLIGDINGDGTVTNLDIQGLLDLVSSQGGGSVDVVPEPASVVLLCVGALGLVVVGRRLKINHLLPSPPMPRPYSPSDVNLAGAAFL